MLTGCLVIFYTLSCKLIDPVESPDLLVLVSQSGSSPPITAYTSPVTPRSEGVTGGALSVAACVHFLRPNTSHDFTLASSCDFRGGAPSWKI